tara:strand:+ start:1208 stop:1624 length:417 start_codon:yes stop_codon:yes gene_type:complete
MKRKTQKSKKTFTGTKTRKKLQFLFNPKDPKRSFDVYIDKNPNDTIPIKYSNVNDVKATINKLEQLYKTNQYPHKRIWQVAMIMNVRLNVIDKYKNTKYKNVNRSDLQKRKQLSNRYFQFLKKRTQEKEEKYRKQMIF